MKELPILFSAPMVRALLEGRKTQTRRIVKEQPTSVGRYCVPFSPEEAYRNGFLLERWPEQERMMGNFGRCVRVHCPYGKLGDLLWVREAFQPLLANGVKWSDADYATGEGYAINYVATEGRKEFACARDERITDRITSPIHMPRWASRITLEVTEVRVQRLQEISGADCRAEGIATCDIPPDEEGPRRIGYMVGPDDGKSGLDVRPQDSYRKLWESINGAGSWDANPWVWSLTFKMVRL